MLVEFRVKNFRSLRDEQVLSLVASKDKTLQATHTMNTGMTAAPHLLRSAVIYGANAGGKSNLINALWYMRGVVLESFTTIKPGQTFAVQPFKLDNSSSSQPTEFEITFIFANVRYQYGFAMTTERIMSEYLLVYKNFKPQRWFERQYDENTSKDMYKFGSGFKHTKNTWELATRPNALFLSTAVQFNSEALLPVFNWFATDLVIVNEHAPLNPQPTLQMLKQEEGHRQICDFLTAADISISDIEVVTRKVPGRSFQVDFATGNTVVQEKEAEQHQIRFTHVTDQGKAEFDLSEESNGTRSLLFLSALVLPVLRKGVTLVIDELDTSLHTLLVRELVGLFHQPEVNTGGAQLLFSTHDTSLLDAHDLFRRDQIWLVVKDRDQASTLIGLSEFSPRKNEALERGYLIGRYGGIPFLSPTLGLQH